MLRALRINHFAIIDEMEISFAAGMNVLTGETGAGKSIITKAIALLCGARASAELIRSDCDEAEIEGVFEPDGDAAGLLAECGLPAADEVVVRRTIQRNGKGRVYINGSLSAAAVLSQLGARLIHVYGQHEHALLLKPESHLSLLDEYGKLDPARSAMTNAYASYRAGADRLHRVTANREALQQRLDLLRFQVDELSQAKLARGEEEELRRERERQRHAERLQQVCQQSESALYADEDSASAIVGRVLVQLQEAARIDPSFESVLDTLKQAAVQIDEAALELRRSGERIERDPQRLEEIEERLALLARLKRKYDADADGLVDQLDSLQTELQGLEGDGTDLDVLRREVAERASAAWQAARVLSEQRQAAAARLDRAMAGELGALGMEGTIFRLTFHCRATDFPEAGKEADLSPEGADLVEFFLSANPGEEPRPLAKVASGGELSRIMLALKALTAGAGEVDTLIFDEVDTGIGGTVAEAVGRRLARLAAGRQILSITHLPQIAALADHHLAVEKQVRRGRTLSRAKALTGDARVDEIARMLGAAGSDESRRYALRLMASGPSRAADD